MNSRSLPAILLVLFYILFLASLLVSAGQLPETVATHFDFDGVPNGMMSRSAHLWFMGITGLVFPLVLVGVFALVRRLPVSFIHVPHHDYWLSATRKEQTFQYLFHHSLWLAAMAVAFMLGLNWLVVVANQRQPVHLSTPLVLALGGCFLAGVVIWIVGLLRHFQRPAKTTTIR